MGKIKITEAYKKVLEQLNEAIEIIQKEQELYDITDTEYRNLLKSQLVIEKAKLELLNNQKEEIEINFNWNKMGDEGIRYKPRTTKFEDTGNPQED